MKKINWFILLICTFFTLTLSINADTTKIKLEYTGVGMRSGPGNNFSKLTTLSESQIYPMVDGNLHSSQSGCSAGWYHINDEGTEGYVCASYVTVKHYTSSFMDNCKNNLYNKGFPTSYLEGLCQLLYDKPNWIFEPINTNLDFNYAVEMEASCGNSYTYTSDSSFIDYSCNNLYNTTGYGLYPASKKAVAYYMDPRNFFYEKFVFQFQNLLYIDSMTENYKIGAKSILKNTEFYKYHTNLGRNVENNLVAGAKEGNVNAIFLASRINQELGSTDKLFNLYSGVYSGDGGQYYGLYNYVNFGVSDQCVASYGTTYCGLSAAKSHEWNSFYNGFLGASLFLGQSYIAKHQQTNYLQKFNVAPLGSSSLFVHQYMTNIQAPASESISQYDTYDELDLLNIPFVFQIPVYNGLGEVINNTGSGAQTSGDTPNTVSSTDINTIIKSAGYYTTSNYISGFSQNVSVGSFVSAISSVGGKATVKNQNGTVVSSGNIGTGFVITINNNSNSNTYTVIVNGDTSGDGRVSAVDLLQVQKQILGTYSMSGAHFLAGDTSNDGKISAVDLLQVQKQILGTYTIIK